MDYNLNIENIIWSDIEELDNKYKKLIENYFKNSSIKFNISKNILQIYVENWGIEKFYINNIENNLYINDIDSKIKLENNKKISYDNLINLDSTNILKKISSNNILDTNIENNIIDNDNINDDINDNINDDINDNINDNINNNLLKYSNKNKIKKNKYYSIYYKNLIEIEIIGLCIQIGNWNVFLEMEIFIDNLKKIEYNIYFVIVEDQFNFENFEYLKNKYTNCVILVTSNRGMDIGLFLINLHFLRLNNINHDYLIKLHTKTDNNFRNRSIYNLIGSYDIIINNLKLLSKKNIGMIAGHCVFNYDDLPNVFNTNLYYLNILSRYFYNNDIEHKYLEFAVGTFFIVKNKCFDIIDIQSIEYFYEKFNNFDTFDYHWYCMHYKLDINKKKYVLEHYNSNPDNYKNSLNYYIRTKDFNYRDFMIEHGYERFLGYIIKKNGLSIVTNNN